MRRAARLRLGLAAAVLVLVALAWWSVARQPPAAPETLLPLDPTAITRIEVQAGDHAPRRFEKRADGWWMTAPESARADAAHVARLTDIAAAPVLGWRPATDFDAAKIGLAQPFATLRLDSHTLVFGGLAALAPQRYVQVGDHVALIGAEHATDLAATPDSELAAPAGVMPSTNPVDATRASTTPANATSSGATPLGSASDDTHATDSSGVAPSATATH